MEDAQRDSTQNAKATLYGLLAVLLWSTVATAFKLALESLAIAQLLLLATGFSWLVFALTFVITRPPALTGRDHAYCLLLGLLNPCLYYLVLFAAYDRLPAHIAQPLNYTWAITLALLAIPILKQRLTGRALGGILVSYTGVVILLNPGSNEAASLNWFGVALALGSTLIWATYWLLNTKRTSDPIATMFFSFTYALPIVATICHLGPGIRTPTLPELGYGMWAGLVEMGITFLLWQRALKLTDSAARISQLIFLSPFLSLVIIHYVLGETIGWTAIVGLAVIVIGLLIKDR